MISQISLLLISLSKSLDLLNVVDLKDVLVCSVAALKKQSDQHSPLRMCVNAAAGIALVEGGEEEGRALGGLEGWGFAEVDTLFWIGLCFEGEHVDVLGFH